MNQQTSLQRGLIVSAWLGWMGLIFYFSTQRWGAPETKTVLETLLTVYLPPVRAQLSRVDLDLLNFTIRKIAHFTEYAILAALGYFAWEKSFNQFPIQALRYALVGAILFAISDEFHQLFETGRTSLMTDVLIDSLGASAMTLILSSLVIRSQLS